MEELITRIIDNRESVIDALESVEFYIWESPEIQLIIVSLLFIIIVSFWTLYERLRIKGWKSLIPIYRWIVLFKAFGMRPWLSLFMLIPGINIIMIVVVYINMARVFKRSYFMVPCLFICPLLFIPIVAFGNGKCDHYQPHARFIDQPNRTSQKRPSIISHNVQAKKVKAKPVAEKKSYKQQAECKPRIKGSKPIRMMTRETIKVSPSIVKNVQCAEFQTMPHLRIAKPVEKALQSPQDKMEYHSSSTIQSKVHRRTRLIPGDIRPMKNNVVVVGSLNKALAPAAPRVAPSMHQVSEI